MSNAPNVASALSFALDLTDVTTPLAAQPVLKYPGGKRAIIDRLMDELPKFESYHEPFVGGGALFFALYNVGLLKGKQVVLSDAALRDDLDLVLRRYKVVVDTYVGLKPGVRGAYFYAMRDGDVAALPRLGRAARTLFLNATGFNGLYRVNSGGKFNVPFGDGNLKHLKSEAVLRAAAVAFQGVQLRQCSFQGAHCWSPGALIYVDPPYADVPGKKSFRAYTAAGFPDDMQRSLAVWCTEAVTRGAHVMASNADCPLIRQLYEGWNIEEVQVKRSVNSDGKGRGGASEMILRSWRKS